MVVIIIITGVIGLITGYAAYQWQELRAVDKRLEDALGVVANLEHEITVTRMVLDLAMRKNAHLKRELANRETSLLLVLDEMEKAS